jgi:hypothetical protein
MRAVARAVFVVALATLAGAVPPPLVEWRAAGDHVGEVVTVEGDVVAARTDSEGCVLQFAPDEARAFRVVLLIPLLSDLPPHPEQLYAGRRVRASGRVLRFQGRPEMVLRSADQIEVVDVAAGSVPTPVTPAGRARPAEEPARRPDRPAPSPATDAPRVASPPPAAPDTTTAATEPGAAGTPAPETTAAPSSTLPAPPPPRGLVEAVQRQMPSFDPCERAHARWTEAAGLARTRAVALTRCVDASSYDCRVDAAALAPALSGLEWAAQQVEASCP